MLRAAILGVVLLAATAPACGGSSPKPTPAPVPVAAPVPAPPPDSRPATSEECFYAVDRVYRAYDHDYPAVGFLFTMDPALGQALKETRADMLAECQESLWPLRLMNCLESAKDVKAVHSCLEASLTPPFVDEFYDILDYYLSPYVKL